MNTGESITIIRSKGYTLHYIKPCTMEKGKKMAKVRLENPPKNIFQKLEKQQFDEMKPFPDLGVAKIRMNGKHIMVFQTGEISIRAAEDERDVLETAELLANILKS